MQQPARKVAAQDCIHTLLPLQWRSALETRRDDENLDVSTVLVQRTAILDTLCSMPAKEPYFRNTVMSNECSAMPQLFCMLVAAHPSLTS